MKADYYGLGDRDITELKGKNLGCYCKLCDKHADGKPLGVDCPDCAPCHSDYLLEIANPRPPHPVKTLIKCPYCQTEGRESSFSPDNDIYVCPGCHTRFRYIDLQTLEKFPTGVKLDITPVLPGEYRIGWEYNGKVYSPGSGSYFDFGTAMKEAWLFFEKLCMKNGQPKPYVNSTLTIDDEYPDDPLARHPLTVDEAEVTFDAAFEMAMGILDYAGEVDMTGQDKKLLAGRFAARFSKYMTPKEAS